MNVGSIGQSIINGTYGSESKPLTAYEELKTWCEKHLVEEQYKVVKKTNSYFATIYLIDTQVSEASGMIYFFGSGEVAGISNYTEDEMIEHINEVEREAEKASKIIATPSLTNLGGQMVRKMIEEYERKHH